MIEPQPATLRTAIELESVGRLWNHWKSADRAGFPRRLIESDGRWRWRVKVPTAWYRCPARDDRTTARDTAHSDRARVRGPSLEPLEVCRPGRLPASTNRVGRAMALACEGP